MRIACAAVACLLWGAGCTGTIDDLEPRDQGTPGAPGAPGSPGTPGGPPGPSAIDEQNRAENPDLFATAKKYFPGEAAGLGKKRLFRLTRTQLDLTAKSLLPA